MFIQQKILNQGFIITFILSFAITITSVMGSEVNKKEKVSYCSDMVYVSSGHNIVMREKNTDKSKAIVKIKNGQYMCLIDNTSFSKKWVKAKVVPLLSGVCDSNLSNSEFCKNVGNFPVEWLSKNNHCSDCKLQFDIDEGGNGYFMAIGSCPTGWIEKKEISYIGD